MTDDREVYMNVRSSQEITCPYGQDTPLPLLIRCKENQTTLLVGTVCRIVSDYSNRGKVTYRIDAADPASMRMEASTDGKALGLWGGQQSIPFIKSLFGKDRLLIRMQAFDGTPFETTFPVTGLEQAIAPLREACHW